MYKTTRSRYSVSSSFFVVVIMIHANIIFYFIYFAVLLMIMMIKTRPIFFYLISFIELVIKTKPQKICVRKNIKKSLSSSSYSFSFTKTKNKEQRLIKGILESKFYSYFRLIDSVHILLVRRALDSL